MEHSPRKIADDINRLSLLLRSGSHVGGLNPAQWAALRFIAHAGERDKTPGGVTRYLGATKGTVSQTLIALEKKGYISRTKSDRDGRSTRLELTESGETLIRRDPLQDIEAAAAAMGDDGPVLAMLLERLLHSLEELAGFDDIGVSDERP